MLTITIRLPSEWTDAVLDIVDGNEAVSGLTVARGSSAIPKGDVVTIDVAREAANDLLQQLRDIGLGEHGTILVQPVDTWLSRAGLDAEQRTPGAGQDAIIWMDVVKQLREESQATWTFIALMVLATLLAGIAIILDSQILVIGAMILGPEFAAVAAIGVALLRRHGRLFRQAVTTLIIGFTSAIAVTAALGVMVRWIGWVQIEDVTDPRPFTGFIYHPDKWSFIVGMIAAAAGVIAFTSARREGLAGVFVSVTTIPAAANVGLGLAFGQSQEIVGSLAQLALNLTGMGIAGWLTLGIQTFALNHSPKKRTQPQPISSRDARH